MDHMPMPDVNESHLEPRVARLETGLETLTRNVSEMAVSIRENATTTNQKIDSLVIAVTQAQAPKKTDWSLFISIGFFIMALGSAVFWPLNKTTQDNHNEIVAIQQKFENHQQLEMHPVGKALVERLEGQLASHISLNERELKEHDDADAKMFENLDKKLQTEYQLVNNTLDTKIANLNDKHNLQLQALDEQMQKRFARLETYHTVENQTDQLELRKWRNKAMGLNSPDMVVPLVPKEVPIAK
jgi:vacuolar-type H+-ATPase subunit I/STV1